MHILTTHAQVTASGIFPWSDWLPTGIPVNETRSQQSARAACTQCSAWRCCVALFDVNKPAPVAGYTLHGNFHEIINFIQWRSPVLSPVAIASPLGMDWAGGLVDANVANPVDDVANASPIRMDCAGGRVDASVANPIDDVANRNGLWWGLHRRQCRQPRWRCRQCVANRNGLGWWLRRCQCRQPRWRCRQCVANSNGLAWWPGQWVTNRSGLGWWLHPGLVGIFPSQTCFYRPKSYKLGLTCFPGF